MLTDVWTSAGVLIGVALVVFTGWQWLDPVVAIAVAVNIIYTGFHIVRASVLGLMDSALPPDEQNKIHQVLKSHQQNGMQYHALRTRQSGAERFISFHVLVPGDWTVKRGHDLLENLEADIHNTFNDTTVFTHLEALEDSASYDEILID